MSKSKSIDAMIARTMRAAKNIQKQADKAVQRRAEQQEQASRDIEVDQALVRIATLMSFKQFADCRGSLTNTMKAFWWLLPYHVKHGTVEYAINVLFRGLKQYHEVYDPDYDPVDIESVWTMDAKMHKILERDNDACAEERFDLERARMLQDVEFEKQVTAFIASRRSLFLLEKYNWLMEELRTHVVQPPFRGLRGIDNIHLVLARECRNYATWERGGLIAKTREYYYDRERLQENRAMLERYTKLYDAGTSDLHNIMSAEEQFAIADGMDVDWDDNYTSSKANNS